jgi:serine beta-lactamase-like protein LACTB
MIKRPLLALLAVASVTTAQTSTTRSFPGQQGVPADTLNAPVIEFVTELILREIEAKNLDGVSIALFDNTRTIWSAGFGLARTEPEVLATPHTVYRVGSVAKLVTDVAIMRMVEGGRFDLDVPLADYVPDFQPANPFGDPITLRQLMSHYSGLVREPPVGHYFDPSEPTLAETVASINRTELVYRPGTRIKYSNAALAAAGYALELLEGRPFDDVIREVIFNPLGMVSSSFVPTPELDSRMADGVMWWVDGTKTPAPAFQIAMQPAGSMYSTVEDLATFGRVLLNGGTADGATIVSPETLEEMWTPQLVEPSPNWMFEVGLGFSLVSDFEGTLLARHGGGVYGFSTELSLLPRERIGVMVATNRGAVGLVSRHIAHVALRALFSVRNQRPLPELQLAETPYSDLQVELREYARSDDDLSRSAPDAFHGLLGDYGWPHNGVTILEKDGDLYGLFEWFHLYRLEHVDGDTFRLSRMSAYNDELVSFTRDADGRATGLLIGGSVRLERQTHDQ